MPTAENAQLDYEAGQNFVPMEALSDSGDRTKFTSTGTLWSGISGKAPTVLPDGVATGGVVTPAALGGNDNVDVAALSAYLAGVLTAVGASADEAITRAATDVACINSVTVTSAGAIAVIKGTDSADATFSEVRGAAGGPPLIPVGSIEVAQIRVNTNVAAPIDASEIFQVVGTHQERYDFPLWNELPAEGAIEFLSALPAIHTGAIPKGVYAEFYTPLFAQVSLASDYVPPETSHSVSSTPIYGTTLGSTSSSLGQGSFTAYLQDGITDPLVALKNETLWFRFYPDRYKTAHQLAQGKLGIARTFPAGDAIQAACTVSASAPGVDKAS